SETTNYFKNGVSISTTVTTNFSSANFDEEGNIKGGRSEARRKGADSTTKSVAVVTFDNDGNPALSETTNYFKNGVSISTTVTTDFSSANFDEEGNIKGGSINTVTKRADSTTKSVAVVTFDNDGNPALSETTNYFKNGVSISTTVTTDFSSANFDEEGNIKGGSINTVTKRADSTTKSVAVVTFDNDGNPALSETTNYFKNGVSISTTVTTDFSSANF